MNCITIQYNKKHSGTLEVSYVKNIYTKRVFSFRYSLIIFHLNNVLHIVTRCVYGCIYQHQVITNVFAIKDNRHSYSSDIILLTISLLQPHV